MSVFGLIKKFIKSLFDEKYTVQHRSFNLLAGIVAVIAGFLAIISLIAGNGFIRNSLILVLFLACVICLVIANVANKPILAGILMSLVPGVLIFPLLYVFRGGAGTGMSIWLTFSLVLPWLLVSGKRSLIVFIINGVTAVATILLAHFNPEYVQNIASPTEILVDNIQTMIVVGGALGMFAKFKEDLYEKKDRELLEKDEELKRMMDEAIKANETKSDFLANMSHDIRTPMSAVLGFSDIAKKNIEDTDRVEDCLDKISASSAHLIGLIDKILDISNLEKGSYMLDERESNLRAIFENIINSNAERLEQNHLKFKYNDSQVRVPEVYVDEAKLTQCINAILDNSIRYTKAGGNISITVSQDREVVDGTVNTTIVCKDSGIGMTKEFSKKVFNAFERENTMHQTSEHGVGLGLTITKAVIEIMNGTIEVQSELGVGSEFIIKLPLKVYEHQGHVIIHENDDVDYKSMDYTGRRFLVVEDDEFSAEIMSLSLKGLKAEVDIAEDGAVAVDKVRVAKDKYYDLIFMDIQMPYKDGFEATIDIRNLGKPFHKIIPIVAMTASALEEDKKRAFETGMNDYICKPARMEDVVVVINEQLERYDEWRSYNMN